MPKMEQLPAGLVERVLAGLGLSVRRRRTSMA